MSSELLLLKSKLPSRLRFILYPFEKLIVDFNIPKNLRSGKRFLFLLKMRQNFHEMVCSLIVLGWLFGIEALISLAYHFHSPLGEKLNAPDDKYTQTPQSAQPPNSIFALLLMLVKDYIKIHVTTIWKVTTSFQFLFYISLCYLWKIKRHLASEEIVCLNRVNCCLMTENMNQGTRTSYGCR